jgi:DNA-binding transcriptional regulator YiaG
MNFPDQVKFVRDKLKLSQKQLAEALYVSFATINRWENKRVVPSNLAKNTFYDFCESSFLNVNEIKNL